MHHSNIRQDKMNISDLPSELREPLRPSVALRLGAQLRNNHRKQERSELESRVREKEEHMNMERLQEYEQQLKSKLRSKQQDVQHSNFREMPEVQEARRARVGSDVTHGRQQSLAQSYLQTYRDSIEKLSYREQEEEIFESQVNPHTIIEEYEEVLRNKMNSQKSRVRQQSKSHVVNRSSLHSSRPKRLGIRRNSDKQNSHIQANRKTQASRCHEKKAKQSKKASKVSVKQVKDKHLNETAYFTINVEQPQHKASLSPGADLTISKTNKSMMTIPKNERESKASKDGKARKSTLRTARKSRSVQRSIIGQMRDKSFFADSVQGNAMRKISVRLGLSGVVYNDQGMKFARWPQEHMVKTHAVEQKLRKEVRDRINNHPDVMKKHSFVVSSH